MKTSLDSIEAMPTDLRQYLRQDLARRCSRNPKYSLRAYASFLGVSASFLSHLLGGRRALTEAMTAKLGKRLGLGPEQLAHLGTALSPPPSPHFNQLTLDSFQVIADWYHYAILELALTKDFVPEPNVIARALGISVAEVKAAIDRLVRLQMLEISPRGSWKLATPHNTTVGNDFTAEAFRRLQKQVLEGALSALEEIPLEHRDQSSLTMAMDSRLLPELKQKMKRFRGELAALQEQSARRDQVYHLAFTCYPLLKTRKET